MQTNIFSDFGSAILAVFQFISNIAEVAGEKSLQTNILVRCFLDRQTLQCYNLFLILLMFQENKKEQNKSLQTNIFRKKMCLGSADLAPLLLPDSPVISDDSDCKREYQN